MAKELEAVSSKKRKEKNRNRNFNEHGKDMASLYYALGLIKLSMNYYVVCDIYNDIYDDDEFDDEFDDDEFDDEFDDDEFDDEFDDELSDDEFDDDEFDDDEFDDELSDDEFDDDEFDDIFDDDIYDYDVPLKHNALSDTLWIELYNRFHLLIQDYLNYQMDIEQIKAMRQEVTDIMNITFSFIDQFKIYEYVLNRVEYRFKDEKESHFDKEYYNTYLTNDLMHYIFAEEDKVVVNSKIVELVGQLPMRLSKERFFSYIREAFTLYHGAQKGTIDDFDDMIRDVALLPDSKKQMEHNTAYEQYFDEYKKIIETLEKIDYKTIDDVTYYQINEELNTGIEEIEFFLDSMVFLIQLINDLYTIELLEGDCIKDTRQTLLAKEIIKNINNQCFILPKESTLEKESCNDEFFESIAEQFAAFEGVQEKILSIIEKNEYRLEDVWDTSENQENMETKTLFETLKIVAKLQSGSDFAALDEDEADNEIPEDSYADKVCEHLIDDMRQAFQGWQQPVRRAVMAAVFSQLPVLFNSIDEIQNYINVSLMQCKDEAEQAAVMEILESIMEG